MFEQREDNRAIVDALVRVFGKYSRGDVVLHANLAVIVGREPPDNEYFRLIRKARNRFCKTSGIWTREQPGVGFRLLTVNETLTEEQAFRSRRARRQIGIAKLTAEMIPAKEMTFHQQKVREAILAEAKQIQKKLRDDQRFIDIMTAPKPRNPKFTPIT